MPSKGQRRYKNWLTDGFPGWLQARLEERDWKAVDLAAKLGVNSGVISNYMTGSRNPDPKLLNRIADVMSVSDEEVFAAAGYLRDYEPTDDPRKLELIKRLQTIEFTPNHYAILTSVLTAMQGEQPDMTEANDAEKRN